MSPRSAIRTLFFLLLLTFASLYTDSALSSRQGKKPSAATKTDPTLDACALLTSSEIQTAVSEPLVEARPSAQPAGKIRTSQCLFRTPTFAKSVSLTVATSGGSTVPSALREFWRNQFHATRVEQEETTSEREDAQSSSEAKMEQDARKPRPISGLGDEAFWVGSPISGALYVLQGDAFLRVSVGGVPEESSRLAKSKMVASSAIARLRLMLSTAASRSAE